MRWLILAISLTACAPDTSTRYAGVAAPNYGPPPVIHGRYTSGQDVVELRADGTATLVNGDTYEFSSHVLAIDAVSQRTGALYLNGLTATTRVGQALGSNQVVYVLDINPGATCVKFQIGYPYQWFCL